MQIMSAFERLSQMNEYINLEPADERSCQGFLESTPKAQLSKQRVDPKIGSAVLPNGKRIRLLKTLLTSACERNCYYCPFRAGRDFRRETFKADEMASTFMALWRGGVAEGLFLSSGVAGGGLRTQDQLLATVEILRKKYRYQGYIHLKLMPGAEYDQVEQAMRLADRVSTNLEAPNPQRLNLLAPGKDFIEELLQPLHWVQDIRTNKPGWYGWKRHWPSVTTQYVVGAVGESDLELLTTTQTLNRQLGLARAYFMAFNPVRDTPFENVPAESPLRELRLYQASFLLRDYGFDVEELPFNQKGLLPDDRDPKTAWAQSHLTEEPLEINLVGPEQLLRIPGIGPKGVKAILNARKKTKLRGLEDLRQIGINPNRSAPFILLDGQRPAKQLALL